MNSFRVAYIQRIKIRYYNMGRGYPLIYPVLQIYSSYKLITTFLKSHRLEAFCNNGFQPVADKGAYWSAVGTTHILHQVMKKILFVVINVELF
jgi:hypothetical protein